jgi:hypothetical protein
MNNPEPESQRQWNGGHVGQLYAKSFVLDLSLGVG